MLKTYRGRCHCGAVQFEAALDLAQSTYLMDVSDEETARLPIVYVDGKNDSWESAPVFPASVALR